MERLALLVMHHRRIVGAVWLALFLGGLFSTTQLGSRWSLDFSLPGQPGDQAEQQLIDTYGVSTFDAYIAVVTVPVGETVASHRQAVAGVFDAAVATVPDVKLRIVDFASTGDPGFVTDDGRTTYALIQAPVPVKFGPYIETQLDPALSLKIGPGSSLESLARSGPRYDALQTLTAGGVGTGVLTPIEVIVPAADAAAAAKDARAVDGVQLAVVGTTQGDSAVVDVLPTDATLDSHASGVVDDVRTAVENSVNGDVGITGVGPTIEDYFSAVYHKIPYVLGLIALITYVLLVRTFRSMLLPLKAVALNLISLAAVFGSVVFFWRWATGPTRSSTSHPPAPSTSGCPW